MIGYIVRDEKYLGKIDGKYEFEDCKKMYLSSNSRWTHDKKKAGVFTDSEFIYKAGHSFTSKYMYRIEPVS